MVDWSQVITLDALNAAGGFPVAHAEAAEAVDLEDRPCLHVTVVFGRGVGHSDLVWEQIEPIRDRVDSLVNAADPALYPYMTWLTYGDWRRRQPRPRRRERMAA